MELKAKFDEIKASIKALLAESEQFISDGEYEKANEKLEEVAKLEEQAKTIKAQIKALERSELDELREENEQLKKKAKEPVRVPFSEVDEAQEDPIDEQPPNAEESIKSIQRVAYVKKYGEPDQAYKAIYRDLYGTNWEQRRVDQMIAFAKFVRTGRLDNAEYELLKATGRNIIMTPDTIKSDILMGGFDVANIKATLEEGSNELGGILVPEDFRANIIQRLAGMTVVRSRANIITTARDVVEYPTLEGGNSRYTAATRGTWVDETPASATVAESNPTFGSQRIPVNTYMIRTNVSRNLMEDAVFNLMDYLAGHFADTRAIDEDDAFLVGDGGGKPQGVLGDIQSGEQPGPVTDVNTSTSGDASNLTGDGILNATYALDSQYRGAAVWVSAKNTARDIRKLKDGNGDYLWQAGLANGQPATLAGYPLAESEAMPAVAANAYPLIFGDFRRGYTIVDRVGMGVERVTDSTTVGQNQVALFARARIGGQPTAPWAFSAHQIAA